MKRWRVSLMLCLWWCVNLEASSALRIQPACLNQSVIPVKYLDYEDILEENERTSFEHILTNIVPKRCCNQTRFELIPVTDKVNNSEQWMAMIDRDDEKDYYTMYFPYFAPRYDQFTLEGYLILPVASTPGSAILSKAQHTTRGHQIMKSLASAWELFILTTLLAMIAGFLAWLCEFRSNQKEFPASFFNGSWQGFWWAMVTMTTVGYGDKAPVTVPGRIFTLTWMLTSSVIMSILTAHLTTSLTADEVSIESQEGYIGEEIGIAIGLKLLFEEEINIGAVYKELRRRDVVKEINEDKIEKFLLENYLYATSEDYKGLKVEKIINMPLDIGMAVVGGEDCEDEDECAKSPFYRFIKCSKAVIKMHMMQDRLSAQGKTDSPEKDTHNDFNTTGMQDVIKVVGSTVGFLFFCGCVLEAVKYVKRKKTLISQTGNRDVEMGTVNATVFSNRHFSSQSIAKDT